MALGAQKFEPDPALTTATNNYYIELGPAYYFDIFNVEDLSDEALSRVVYWRGATHRTRPISIGSKGLSS